MREIWIVWLDCVDGSFGGNTSITKWKDAAIADVNAGCFHGENEMTTLHIQFLKITTAHPQAFSDSKRKLTIKDSSITTIKEKGIDIRVRRMHITYSHINDLYSNGLFVLASLDIRLEHLQFHDLRKCALVGLRTETNSAGNKQRLIFKQFRITKSKNESLTLSESAILQKPEMNDMKVTPGESPICPTVKWVRMMTGASLNSTDPLSFAEDAVLSSLTGDKSYCPDTKSNLAIVPNTEGGYIPPAASGGIEPTCNLYKLVLGLVLGVVLA